MFATTVFATTVFATTVFATTVFATTVFSAASSTAAPASAAPPAAARALTRVSSLVVLFFRVRCRRRHGLRRRSGVAWFSGLRALRLVRRHLSLRCARERHGAVDAGALAERARNRPLSGIGH